MFHVCFTPISICFISLHCTFYAFSGTNLLTRCRSVSSCFLLFLVSEKLYRKYSRNGTGQKLKFLFYRREDGDRRAVEDEPRGGHTRPRRVLGLARAWGWCRSPVAPLRLSFWLPSTSDKIWTLVYFLAILDLPKYCILTVLFPAEFWLRRLILQ